MPPHSAVRLCLTENCCVLCVREAEPRVVAGERRFGKPQAYRTERRQSRETLQPVRWAADVNVRAGSNAWNCGAKCKKRNALNLEVIDEASSFNTVRVKRDVNRIAVVVTELVVRR